MARFDRNAPFESVGGIPGAIYRQNGRFFNNGGYEVELYEEGEGENRRPMARMKEGATPALTVDEEEEIDASRDKEIPLMEMHWRRLKAMVEQFGGTWTNREEALKFLSGLKTADEAAAAGEKIFD